LNDDTISASASCWQNSREDYPRKIRKIFGYGGFYASIKDNNLFGTKQAIFLAKFRMEVATNQINCDIKADQPIQLNSHHAKGHCHDPEAARR